MCPGRLSRSSMGHCLRTMPASTSSRWLPTRPCHGLLPLGAVSSQTCSCHESWRIWSWTGPGREYKKWRNSTRFHSLVPLVGSQGLCHISPTAQCSLPGCWAGSDCRSCTSLVCRLPYGSGPSSPHYFFSPTTRLFPCLGGRNVSYRMSTGGSVICHQSHPYRERAPSRITGLWGPWRLCCSTS